MMLTALVIGQILLWIVVLGIGTIEIALLRQVGLLHERLGPVGALSLPGGPHVGEMVPPFELVAIDGTTVAIGGGHTDRLKLLFFLSPSCPICKSLLPIVKSIAREYGKRLDVILASDGDENKQAEMVRQEHLQAFPLILSTELGMRFHVSKLPYAVLIREDGRIAAKGLINNREHLESLFEAYSRNVGSLQEYRNNEMAGNQYAQLSH